MHSSSALHIQFASSALHNPAILLTLSPPTAKNNLLRKVTTIQDAYRLAAIPLLRAEPQLLERLRQRIQGACSTARLLAIALSLH